MKNIILGVIGIFITFYTLLLGLNILYVQTQKNQLEKHVSRIVKNTLESEYQKGEEAFVEELLLEEITAALSTKNASLEIKVQGIDLEKGFLSVKVTKQVEMLNGREKTIVVEKTAIMERAYSSNDKSAAWQHLATDRNRAGWCV